MTGRRCASIYAFVHKHLSMHCRPGMHAQEMACSAWQARLQLTGAYNTLADSRRTLSCCKRTLMLPWIQGWQLVQDHCREQACRQGAVTLLLTGQSKALLPALSSSLGGHRAPLSWRNKD